MDGSSGFQSQSKDGSAGFQWMGGSSGFQSQGQVDGSNGFQWSQWGGFGGFQKQLNGSSIKRKEGSSSSFQGQGKDLHSAQGHDKDKIFQYQADDSNVVQNEMDGSSRNENGSRRRRDLSQAEIIHQFTQQMDTISSQNVQLEHQVTQLQAENAVLQSTHCSRRKRAPSQAKLIRTVQSQGKDLQSFQVHGKDKAYHNFQLEAGGTDVFQNQADDFSNKGKKENRPKRELSQAEIIHEFTQQLNTLSSQTVQLEHQVNQLQAENDALKARHW
nr:hypothetical protein BaRGS_015163 [Batillaria attramentaria]